MILHQILEPQETKEAEILTGEVLLFYPFDILNSMQNKAYKENKFIYFDDPVQKNVTINSSKSKASLTTGSRKTSYSGLSLTELKYTFVSDALDN